MINLCPLNVDHVSYIARWKSDSTLAHLLMAIPQVCSLEEAENWIRKNNNSPNQYLRGIINVTDNKIIGVARLMFIDKLNGNAKVGLYLGDIAFRGKGFGEMALRQLLVVAFTELNLHRVFLEVMDENIGAIRLYQKVGFKQEGYLIEHYQSNGKFYNVIIFGLLKRNYEV